MKKFNEFLTEKNITAESLKEKSAEDIAGLYNEFNAENFKAFEEAIEGKTDKKELEELKAAFDVQRMETLENQSKELNRALEAQGLLIKKLSAEEKKEVSEKSFMEILEDNKEALLEMKSDKKASLSLKAVGDMLISSNVSGGNVPVEQRLEGLNMLTSRAVRLLDIVSRGTASSNVISWVYQTGQEGAAGGTAEGALKNQIDFDLVVDSETVKKRTAFIKISEEMLGDISFMESAVRLELTRELLKDVESQVYEGDGTGNNLNGIRTVATPFAAGSFAGTIDNANAVDVMTVAMNQIMVADHDMATYILMNPSDVTALKMVKVSSSDKRYVERLAMVGGQLSLDGVPIIPTTLVAADEYLIGNFSMATVYDKGALSIEVGRDSDDFTKNMITILAEWRGLVIVKQNDRTAFVAGDFSTDAALLETP